MKLSKTFDIYTPFLLKYNIDKIGNKYWILNDKYALISRPKFSSRAQISNEIGLSNNIFNMPFKFKG